MGLTSKQLFLNTIGDKLAAFYSPEQRKADGQKMNALQGAAAKDLGGNAPTTSLGMSSQYQSQWHNPGQEYSSMKTVLKDNPRWHETQQNFGHQDYMVSRPHRPESVNSNANTAMHSIENGQISADKKKDGLLATVGTALKGFSSIR